MGAILELEPGCVRAMPDLDPGFKSTEVAGSWFLEAKRIQVAKAMS